MHQKNNHLPIFILGPTASGKTKMAVELAYRLQAEIVSADSRQLYKGMDIGSGKDLNEYTLNEKQIPYHMIDMLEVGDTYHVYQYMQDAKKCIGEITSRGRRVIVCGGSGMYLDSLLSDFSYAGIPEDGELRAKLEIKSHPELVDYFKLLPQTEVHRTADVSTQKRTIRAIEIATFLTHHPTFKPLSPSPIAAHLFGVDIDVETRRMQITQRLLQRLQNGMIEEVQRLLSQYSSEVLIRYGLEYKFITLYLTGKITYPEMLNQLNTAIHQFAKRQMTYFRKMERDGKEIYWIKNPQSVTDAVNEMMQVLELKYGKNI
jgi:tRNA dimethylallyltransferase